MVNLQLKGSLVSSINLYFDVTTRVQPATFRGHDFPVIDPPFKIAHIVIIFLNYLVARESSLHITIYLVKISHIPVNLEYISDICTI